MVTLLGSELEIQYITLHTVYSNLSVYKCELQRNLEVIHRQFWKAHFFELLIDFLLQVQRSYLREDGEARDHHSPS